MVKATDETKRYQDKWPDNKYYRAQCYKCDDYSYPIEIKGKTIVAEAEGLTLVNLKWDGDLCTLYVQEKNNVEK